VGLAGIFHARSAGAQPTKPPDGIAVGDFWFRPRVEVRLRGEYDHDPVATSGEVPVLGTALGMPLGVTHQWVVHERTRVALTVDRGPLAASVVVQDARIAGFPSPVGTLSSSGAATTSFHVAYLEAHTPESHPSFVRIGRQEIALGEGRLLGVSDWLLTPRSLDAARARWVTRQFDFDALAAILAPPGAVPPEYDVPTSSEAINDGGTGAQLYGLAATLHLDPLLHGQLAGLGRVVRSPYPASLTPSDTLVLDARAFGDRAGLSYSAEVAYELGHLALVGGNRDIRAWAATGHADWQTGWPLRPMFSLGGSFATGEDGTPTSPTQRFDPMLPDARAGLGQMGLYAWSNVLDAAFTTSFAPVDEFTFAVAYRYVHLADSRGAWFTASLLPVGQNPKNDDPFLGHELDASVTYAPLDGLALSAGYGAFVTGGGARAILSGRPDSGPRLLSAAFLQASFAAP
jgi:hypothetical protein